MVSSSWETITIGVPQGSILGPLLFIIYLNDLPRGLYQGTKPVIYADDTSVLLTAKNDEELKIKVNRMLDYMIGWFSANGLALNVEKTNIMKFTSSCHQNEAFQIIYLKKIISGIHSFSSLSYDRSKASSKASSPHSAIQSFLFQMRVLSPFLKVIQ